MASVLTREAREGKARMPSKRTSRRLIAVLGGTTRPEDLGVALRHLVGPSSMVRGPVIREYESSFARQIGVGHAFSFSAGRVALYGILRGLGIGDGDEVLLQVPTHIVVPNAVRYVGAKPVYVDCRLDSYNMDLDQAERLITPRTRAIVLQHTFGNPADLDRALALAQKYALELIEDCVHALGATYAGRQVGSLGKAAFFSTEETKTISSTMGGIAVTDDRELAARLRAFQEECCWPSASKTARYVFKLVLYHFLMQPSIHRYPRYLYEFIGKRNPMPRATAAEEMRGERPANYEQRLANAQAALALSQLRRLEANLAHRRAITEVYGAILPQAGFDTVKSLPDARPAFVRYPVWVEDRTKALRAEAPRALLGTWFTSVLEESLSPAHAGYQPGSCPRAEAAAQHLVNLPTHLRVTEQDAEAIAWSIANSIPTARSDK